MVPREDEIISYKHLLEISLVFLSLLYIYYSPLPLCRCRKELYYEAVYLPLMMFGCLRAEVRDDTVVENNVV